ncbi:MAG: peptide chain release factor N(5)-glutamine methyltransferase [Phycisphaerales bacterium JB037]
MPPADQTWTTRRLLAWMHQAFEARELDSPRLMAELLLSHVIGCDRLRLYMDTDRPASPLERQTLRELVARALNNEPVQYLVGQAYFFGIPFKVAPGVLIPRPSTETIIDHVLHHARARHTSDADTILIADVCTGSGAIALALLKNLTAGRAIASDLSPQAIAIAADNAKRLELADRVDFVEGDLLDPVRAHPAVRPGSLRYLVSNPPYIPDGEWDAVEPNVRDHEPEIALRASPDGLTFVRPILEQGPELLEPGGLILVEIAAATADHARAIAESNKLLEGVRILDDGDGLPRVVVGRRRN